MTDLFDKLIGPLIDREGGYSNRASDAGGETNWGITVAVARENGYTGPMKALTRDQAIRIYKAKYWVKAGLYLIAPLSEKVAEELFDTGVNAGTGTAAILFQRCLNALNRRGKDYADIGVDGGIGNESTKAFTAFLKRNKATGESVMIKALNCLQGAHYIELAEGREFDEDNLNGWLANRVGLAA